MNTRVIEKTKYQKYRYYNYGNNYKNVLKLKENLSMNTK